MAGSVADGIWHVGRGMSRPDWAFLFEQRSCWSIVQACAQSRRRSIRGNAAHCVSL